MQAGDVLSFDYVVTAADLADRIGVEEGDRFPPVLATSRLVALMEVAAARQMQASLADGQLSVGIDISSTHSAPTVEGGRIRVTSSFTGMDGKRFAFDVYAKDGDGVIASGNHHRAIIAADGLLKTARNRKDV